MVAACVVLSGCTSADVDEQATTTSPIITGTQGNPWELPIEQRPALFDPCAEIPVEAVEQGVGGPVEEMDLLYNHRPGELFSCGWRGDEIHFGVIGTWRSRQDFLTDTEFVLLDESSEISGREGLRARDRSDQRDTTCYQVFFTSRGAVVINANIANSLSVFQGKKFSKACDVLDVTMGPILGYLPEGDF